MKRKEILESVSDGRLFKSWDSVPAEHQDGKVAVVWFIARNNYSIVDPIDSIGKYREIEHLLTKDQKLECISYNANLLSEICPPGTSDYEDYVIRAMYNHPIEAFNVVNPEFRTISLARKICSEIPITISYRNKEQGWLHDLLDQEMIETVTLGNLRFSMEIPENKISWNHMKNVMLKNEHMLWLLKDYGRSHLLTNMLKEGIWPSEFNPPINIDSAINSFRTAMNLVDRAVWRAYLKGQDTQVVLDKMAYLKNDKQAASGIDDLMEIYSDKELVPFAKRHHRLLEKLLEDGLGL